ncbi:MAG: sulfatase-like hydrolase/transferase, partial [Candidatus Omnitrophica bacterium]|nr:sulfatase-like hydrolase/transferase [Candidatus Omnitrophota bacterium]
MSYKSPLRSRSTFSPATNHYPVSGDYLAAGHSLAVGAASSREVGGEIQSCSRVLRGWKPLLRGKSSTPLPQWTRRVLLPLVLLVLIAPIRAEDNPRPNVLLILTDDQGYGDLGCHGNPYIDTPTMDSLHQESTHLTQFYVMPVCTPTRACLMTGRYHYRTGAYDTFEGRAMMHPEEYTVAEAFHDAGYRTGIFGKWHLGDNHPMRPIDQGFDEAVVHRGGGIAHYSDVPGNTYFSPVLQHNGKPEHYSGYGTDIFTEQAVRFIEASKDD